MMNNEKRKATRLPFFNQQQPIFILNHDNSVLGAPPFLAVCLFSAAGMPHPLLLLRQECRISFFFCGRNAASPFTVQRNNLSATWVIPIFCVFFQGRSLFLVIQGILCGGRKSYQHVINTQLFKTQCFIHKYTIVVNIFWN